MTLRDAWFWLVLGSQTALCGARAVAAGIRGDFRFVEAMQRNWGKALVGAAAVEVRVEGLQHIDRSKPYVILSNHTSGLDPLVLFHGLPIGFTYVAKSELLAIPIFGWIIGRTGAVFIDRANNASARGTLSKAADRVRSGQSVLVFPEGTRSLDGTVQDFKKGGFVLALEAQVELLPITIVGAFELCPTGSYFSKAGVVTLRIHQPISTRSLGYEQREALMAQAKEVIAQGLGAPASGARDTLGPRSVLDTADKPA